jgi:hypothetical protein
MTDCTYPGLLQPNHALFSRKNPGLTKNSS